MKRREFIAALGGAAAMPLAARAQQPERMRRIGVLLPAATDDPEFQARLAAFQQELQRSGWIIGSNMRIDIRWGGGNADRTRRYAAELVELAPDVILAHGSSSRAQLLQKRPAPCRSFSRSSAIRSVPALSKPWRGRAATSPVSYHRIQHRREMAGAAQGDRAQPDAGGGPSGFNPRLRNQSVCCHPGRGAVAQGGDKPDQHAQMLGKSSAPLRPSRAPRMAA